MEKLKSSNLQVLSEYEEFKKLSMEPDEIGFTDEDKINIVKQTQYCEIQRMKKENPKQYYRMLGGFPIKTTSKKYKRKKGKVKT